ncbi:MAG: HAD family hydrolase [bacterium]|nr:HAD family hydrolase [bacterium]
MEEIRRAVFLDRDGVINEIIYHQDIGVIDSPFTPEQFHLMDGAAWAIQEINRIGLLAIVVTNQPGIAKGHLSKRVLDLITEKMIKELALGGACLDDIYMCLHHPKGSGNGSGDQRYVMDCSCRKPKPGLLIEAAKKHQINLAASYMIGDSITDIQAGASVGCTTFLIGHPKCDLCRIMEKSGVRPDFIVPSLLEAVKVIKYQENLKNSFQGSSSEQLCLSEIFIDDNFYAHENPLSIERKFC